MVHNSETGPCPKTPRTLTNRNVSKLNFKQEHVVCKKFKIFCCPKGLHNFLIEFDNE